MYTYTLYTNFIVNLNFLVYVCVCVSICVGMYVCMHVCVNEWIYICVSTCKHVVKFLNRVTNEQLISAKSVFNCKNCVVSTLRKMRVRSFTLAEFF